MGQMNIKRVKRPSLEVLEKARSVLNSSSDPDVHDVSRWLYWRVIDLKDRAEAKRAGISVSYLRFLHEERGYRVYSEDEE